MLNLHLGAGPWNSQHVVQRNVRTSKGGHHQAEKNKSPKQLAETVGSAKSTIWYILKKEKKKKKKRIGELTNTKRPRGPWKTSKVDDYRILSLVKKNPFITSGGGRCVIVQSTIKRRHHVSKYRGYTTRCKPLVTLKNSEARSDCI